MTSGGEPVKRRQCSRRNRLVQLCPRPSKSDSRSRRLQRDGAELAVGARDEDSIRPGEALAQLRHRVLEVLQDQVDLLLHRPGPFAAERFVFAMCR